MIYYFISLLIVIDMVDFNTNYHSDINADLELNTNVEEIIQKKQKNVQDPLAILYKYHPECVLDYTETINQKVQLQKVGSIGGDENHKSQPFLTVFEKTKILGTRTNQLAQGAKAYIAVPSHITKTLDIAKLELEQRRLPFIVKRPMPDGTFEFWRLKDLMIL